MDRDTPDDVVWGLCQDRGYYFLTANRNEETDDSLGATIRREGKRQILPVFTPTDANQTYQSNTYLDEVVVKLLEYLLDQDNCRGSGQLFPLYIVFTA